MEFEDRDPFFETMFSRMSPGARSLFGAAQLDEIKRAFSARTFGAHALDVRLSLRPFRKSYYLVLLGGREQRTRERPRSRLRLASALVLGAASIAASIFLLHF
jgi:hypothetical protein